LSASEESLALLRSIDSSLKSLLHLSQQRMVGPRTAKGPEVASDQDLLGKWGNPEVKASDPRDWTGPTMKGSKFSECPPDYLDLLAERFDYFAVKAEEEDKRTSSGKPVAPYNRKDAARARGWAARMRAGKHTPPPVTESGVGWAVTEDEPEVTY
jgi:hypothetical protein